MLQLAILNSLQAQSMAQLNMPWMGNVHQQQSPWMANPMNGSNMSLNLPSQNFFLEQQHQQHNGMWNPWQQQQQQQQYPYQMMPNQMMNGEWKVD